MPILHALLACLAAGPAQGPGSFSHDRLRVLFTNVPGSATSIVPGLLGVRFLPGSSGGTFDRPWVSRSGGHWAIRARTQERAAVDQVVLVDGVVAEREGNVPPFAPIELYGEFDVRLGVDDEGGYAFVNNLAGSSPNDDYVVRVSSGGVYTVVAREGLAIPALPGSTFDDDLGGAVLLNNGDVAFAADLVDGGGVTATTDEIVVLGGGLVAQEGVTIPIGQTAGATAAWENFSFEDQWFDDSGNVLLFGDLTSSGDRDLVVVHNGTVVLQENAIIAGSGFANPIDIDGIFECAMDHGGHWYARGRNDQTEQEWVVRDGAVIAREGGNVLPTPGRFRTLFAALDGAQVVPPTTSSGHGTAFVTIDTQEDVVHFRVLMAPTSGAEIAAAVHGFTPAGANAPALFPLPLGTQKDGSFAYPAADEASILAGLSYISIASVTFPAGEIRGQLVEVPEVWDDRDLDRTYFLHTGDAHGHWMVGGTTNGASSRNAVLVLDGTAEIAREGDPIDVDGDGLFDDDAFLDTFGTDDAFLRDDGTFVFVATIRNAAGVTIGEGIFERSTRAEPSAYCFGDGLDPAVTTPCPCANTGASGRGCASSFNAAGARLVATGSAALDDVVLLGDGMQPSGIAIFLQGDAIDPFGFVFGDGLTCTGGALVRLRAVALINGTAGFPVPPETVTLSQRGNMTIGSGRTASYTVFYRNAAAAFCPPATFNVANSVRILW